jgi:hypothetical protein
MAVSLYHQGSNIDRARLRELTGQPEPTEVAPPRASLHHWLLQWIEWEGSPSEQLDSLPGVAWHASDAWARRHGRNIVLVHYDELSSDLEGSMRRLAARLDISVAESTWSDIVAQAGFEAMRGRAEHTAPDPADILKDRARFFRRGSSGAGREVLSPAEMDQYGARIGSLAAPDVVAWLHHDNEATSSVGADRSGRAE